MNKINPSIRSFMTPELKAAMEQELNAIKNDSLVFPFIRDELKITGKEAITYIAALLDYQEDVHYCAHCPGLDHCQKSNPHFSMTLRREYGVIARHYDPCPKMISLASFNQRYLICSFPVDWRDANFSNISTSVSARNQALSTMMAIGKGKSDRWIYLTGSNGSGKTYMLACFANDITLKRGKGAFCDTTSLLEELKSLSINNKEEFEVRMKALREASVVVFDDFGNEFKTEYSFTSLLYPIISYRAKENKVTCFASDFSMDQIASMYQAKIGPERAAQFRDLLKFKCKKEYDVTGVNLG